MNGNLSRQALGLEKADCVYKGGFVLNVFTQEWIPQDVAVSQGVIVGTGDYNGVQTVDVRGKYLVPGLIDAHVHIESGMVTPEEFGKILLRKGTCTIIADPHELVNVKGTEALDYLLEAAANSPLSIYAAIPSSVPSTDFETNGAGEFTAEMMKPYHDRPDVIALGETMRFYDVMNGEKRMADKLELFADKMIDGHAPGIRGKEVQAYKLAGVRNDHECTSFDEALDKLRAGFSILVREGSGARNVESIIRGFVEHGISFDHCAFCTDDKHLDDIEREGHISWNVRKAISLGVDPITAYCMATIQPAKMYRLEKKGAIAPGCDADFLILNDPETVEICQVIKDGLPIEKLPPCTPVLPKEELLHSVHIPQVKKSDIAVPRREQNDIIELQPHELLTKHLREPVGGGEFFEPDAVYNKLCVIERHGRNGNIAAAPLKGFGIRGGAIGTTVAHDSHNMILAGDNDADILMAAKELEAMQGGYVIIENQKVVGALPLRICGLMSTESGPFVQKRTAEMLKTARRMGISEEIDPFITLSFTALPVIPEIRLCDTGLYDVVHQKMLTK